MKYFNNGLNLASKHPVELIFTLAFLTLQGLQKQSWFGFLQFPRCWQCRWTILHLVETTKLMQTAQFLLFLFFPPLLYCSCLQPTSAPYFLFLKFLFFLANNLLITLMILNVILRWQSSRNISIEGMGMNSIFKIMSYKLNLCSLLLNLIYQSVQNKVG